MQTSRSKEDAPANTRDRITGSCSIIMLIVIPDYADYITYNKALPNMSSFRACSRMGYLSTNAAIADALGYSARSVRDLSP
jgi:hypothetical protein